MKLAVLSAGFSHDVKSNLEHTRPQVAKTQMAEHLKIVIRCQPSPCQRRGLASMSNTSSRPGRIRAHHALVPSDFGTWLLPCASRAKRVDSPGAYSSAAHHAHRSPVTRLEMGPENGETAVVNYNETGAVTGAVSALHLTISNLGGLLSIQRALEKTCYGH